MSETVELPPEKLSVPSPLGELLECEGLPVREGEAYVVFYDPGRLDPARFYDRLVDEQVSLPCQMLFVPLTSSGDGPAVAMGAFEDIANWVEQVRQSSI